MWRGKCAIFTASSKTSDPHGPVILGTSIAETRICRGFRQNCIPLCTISGHRPVNGVHSIENTCTYNHVFFVDWKNRRSTTGSFFDSFLSFSGWCNVRDSSEVTFLIERLRKRASKGL